MFFNRLSYKGHFGSIVLLISTVIFLGAVTSAFKSAPINKNEVAAHIRQMFLKDVNVLKQQAEALRKAVILLEKEAISLKQAQEAFYRTKQAYKSVEYLLEYLNPEIAKNLNGAPLPKVLVEEERYQTLAFQKPKARTFPAHGLQVLEEQLFADEFSAEQAKEAIVQAYTLEENANLFLNTLHNQPLNDKQVLESLREELVRVMAMGITGFDAPTAGREIENTVTALQPVLANVTLYEKTSSGLTTTLSREAAGKLKAAIEYLQQNPNFETLDRLYFIREFADPAYAALTRLQAEIAPAAVTFSKPVNDKATGIFSPDFLQAAYYAKQDREVPNHELLELGKVLFFDPVLSANNQRSCASCHAPDKAFADGLPRSVAFNFNGNVSRNSPTLLNAVFSNAYFWDSRAQYLQDQVPDVVVKSEELHGDYEAVVEKLKQSSEYKKMFKKAFADQKSNYLNTNTINRAIAAYVQGLVALNSPFDRYMRRETAVLDESAKRGFNLFMGKAACGTCHFAPIFNGTVPPRYLESESEVLGVTATADFTHPTLDADVGKAAVVPAEVYRYSFKTPSVRNAAATAPYMHNGAFANLNQVLDFYDAGGGVGLGLEVPHQTLPDTPLNLSKQDKEDLISFMQALTDTTAVSPIPKKLPQFSAHSDLNKRKVGGTY